MSGEDMRIQCKIRAIAFWLLSYLCEEEHLSFMESETTKNTNPETIREEMLPKRRLSFMTLFASQKWQELCLKKSGV